MTYIVMLMIFFFKQKTAYEMRISDWSSDVCSSDLPIQKQCIDQDAEESLGLATACRHIEQTGRVLIEGGVKTVGVFRQSRCKGRNVRQYECELKEPPTGRRFPIARRRCRGKCLVEK